MTRIRMDYVDEIRAHQDDAKYLQSKLGLSLLDAKCILGIYSDETKEGT